ncbi:TPA: ATP-grasp domain-containing protein, partial [Mannheimia haemolytica]|nr:ATP-grasp domain-containing protein [Mannheimia haemolytica]
FVCGDEIIFNEVSPRPHDTGIVTMASQELSQFALHARAILGLPIPEIYRISPAASKAIVVEGKSDNVRFGGVDKVLAEIGTNIRLFGKGEVNGHRRLGVILARDENTVRALEKARRAYDKLDIQL